MEKLLKLLTTKSEKGDSLAIVLITLTIVYFTIRTFIG